MLVGVSEGRGWGLRTYLPGVVASSSTGRGFGPSYDPICL